MTKQIKLTETVPDHLYGKRLDQVLAEMFPDYSRSRIKEWILAGWVNVNNRLCDTPREKLLGGEHIDINAEIDFRDITPKFFSDLKKFNPFGPDNAKPIFCTHNVYDYGTSKVVGRDQEHIKLELVDNKSNNVMNGIAFGQSSHVRFIKTKRSFDICYSIEENTHKRGEVQLQIEDIKPN